DPSLPASVPSLATLRVTVHDRLTPDGRTVACELRRAVSLVPGAGADVFEAAGRYERPSPQVRRLHVAEDEHPPAGEARELVGDGLHGILPDMLKAEVDGNADGVPVLS